MPDEVLADLWKIKDKIAREHGYDVNALEQHMQEEQEKRGGRVVDRRAMKKAAVAASLSRKVKRFRS